VEEVGGLSVASNCETTTRWMRGWADNVFSSRCHRPHAVRPKVLRVKSREDQTVLSVWPGDLPVRHAEGTAGNSCNLQTGVRRQHGFSVKVSAKHW